MAVLLVGAISGAIEAADGGRCAELSRQVTDAGGMDSR